MASGNVCTTYGCALSWSGGAARWATDQPHSLTHGILHSNAHATYQLGRSGDSSFVNASVIVLCLGGPSLALDTCAGKAYLKVSTGQWVRTFKGFVPQAFARSYVVAEVVLTTARNSGHCGEYDQRCSSSNLSLTISRPPLTRPWRTVLLLVPALYSYLT